MTEKAKRGVWTEVRAGVRSFDYSFGPGRANAFAFETPEGWAIVSPPCGVDESVYTGLGGEVTALIATNGFHHMGLPEWQARFPKATVHAAPKAAKRIHKKQKGLSIRGLEELAERFGDRAQVATTPGKARIPDTHAFVSTEDGVVWYGADTINNTPKLPKGVFGFLFKVTGSGPGLTVNHLVLKIFGIDKKALRPWLLERLEGGPIQGFVPGHGDLLIGAEEANERLLAAVRDGLPA